MGFANILDSLGWAIMHSTWQGGVLALAVLMFRSLTRDSQASLRCGFQVMCLLTALIAFIGTFLHYQLGSLGSPKSIAAAGIFELGGGQITFDPAQTAALPSDIGSIAPASLQSYIPWVGTLWVLGFSILSLKYAAALWMTHQLRYRGISDAPAQWRSRFQTLSLNAGIRRQVELFISDRVSGPLTLGFFKPVVLVPASFFMGLPPDQVEAILLHEIAHIRRHDYLINLLQTAIRTIFFYHPAIRYISGRIDDDRERACDDFAVALTRDPQALARGLAALRLNLTPQSFALAADDGKSSLVSRLNRLVDKEDVGRRPEQVIASAAALIVAAGLYANYSPLANAHPDKELEPQMTVHPSGKLSNYRFEPLTKDGKTFTVKLADNGTRWASLNGTWYDVDKNDWVVAKLPDVPEAPKAPNAEKVKSSSIFKDKVSQYKVDLDYYIASLENTMRSGNKGISLEKQLEKAEAQRLKLEDDDFGYNFNYKVAPPVEPEPVAFPQPISFPEPDVDVKAPVIKIANHELAGAHPSPGLYIDGERVATEDWSDDLQDRLDDAIEEFESQMENVEEYFEDALEVYEDYMDEMDDGKVFNEKYLAKANESLAQAVLKSNKKHDKISKNLDKEITEILQNADEISKNAMKIAEVHIEQALKDAKNNIQWEDELTEEERREVEEELREALQDLREEKRELIEESRMDRADVLEAAREARQEALQDRQEWQRDMEREAERAKRDALRAQRDAQRSARDSERMARDAQRTARDAERAARDAERSTKDYQKSAEWRAKEAAHVKNDYREYHKEMLGQLKDDGLINKSAKSATISYVDRKMHVNGKPVPSSKEDAYCEINEEFHINKHSNTTIRFMTNGVEIENGYFKYGDTYSTRWTYNDQ